MINNDLLCDMLKSSLNEIQKVGYSNGLVTFPIPQDDEFKKDFFDTLDHMIYNSLIHSLEILDSEVSFKITSKGIKVAHDIF